MQSKRVFEPIVIGSLVVKNRIEAAPTSPPAAPLATPDGYPTHKLIEYIRMKAKGGAGIVTVGDSAIDNDCSRTISGQLVIHSDKMIPSLSELSEAIKRYGGRASLELNHGGGQTVPEVINGKNPIAPSPISTKFYEVQEMSPAMIDDVEESFSQAAFRLKCSGFDMVLLHGAHGWLLAQFLSPYTNKRSDGYGGSLEKGLAFLLKLLNG